MRMRLLRSIPALLALGLMGGPSARAGMITYIQTVTGSGSLGGAAFTDALVTFTQTADTAGIGPYVSGSSVQADTSTVAVAGLGSGSFTDPTALVVFPDTGRFDLFRGRAASGGTIILDQGIPGLVGYDLTTAIGPVTGSGDIFFNRLVTFATSAGGFNLASVSGDTTFRAITPAAVPEPASLISGGLAGLAGMGYAWRRRRAKATA